MFFPTSRVQLGLSALRGGPADGAQQCLSVVQSSEDVAPGGRLRP